MKRALLLTGCAGFIGINFLEYLIKDTKNVLGRYDRIYSIDIMGYATEFNEEHYRSLISENNKFVHITCDLNDERLKNNLPNSYKWDVINFASNSHVDNSISSPFDNFNKNAIITSSIVSHLGIKNINHFFQASTDEIYGEIPLSEKNEKTRWFKTWSNMKPNNPYSASKAAQDCFLMAMKHTFGLGVTLFRMANQFGPHQHPEKMLPASILRAVNGDTIKIYGEGINIRQWTPVRLTVQYIYDMLVNEYNPSIVHYAHPCKLMNNNEVVKIWGEILKNDWSIDIKTEFIEDRKGHDTMYALDQTEKTLYEKSDIIEEFRDTIKFYVKNANNFRK